MTAVVFTPVDHPYDAVRTGGWPLDAPYVEQCFTPVVGPTVVLLLRRMPSLRAEAVPASVDLVELSLSLGLGRGTGERSAIVRTLDRLVGFNLGRLVTKTADLVEIDVFLQVPNLSHRRLEKVPACTIAVHDRFTGQSMAARIGGT